MKSAEKEEDEEERRVGSLRAQVEAHDGGSGWNRLLATVKRHRDAWDACSDAVEIAKMHLKDTQLDLVLAQLAVMDKIVEMSLAREEALQQLVAALERVAALEKINRYV